MAILICFADINGAAMLLILNYFELIALRDNQVTWPDL